MNAIKDFNGEHRFLSNFYPCRIIYNGYSYTCVEAAFQAEKCADPRGCAQFSELTASDAKRLGRTVDLREDWEDAKITVMRHLLHIKFVEHPALLDKLLATGDAQLVEGNRWHDNFWGDCICERCAGKPGRNMLGQLLMNLRSSMQSNTPSEDMPASFQFMNIDIEPLQLFTKARVLSFMDYNGANDTTLDMLREQYRSLFGTELVWRYPIFDSVDDGCVIIPVREGFLWLPYDEKFESTYEYYQIKAAELLTADAVKTLLQEMNAYISNLQSALAEMLPVLGGVMTAKEEPTMMLALPDGQVLRAVISHDAAYPALRIDLESTTAHMPPEPLCFVEHNPNRPEGHRLCICAYTEGGDDPDYYKSYSPCEDNRKESEK